MKIKKLILLVFALSLIVSTFGLPNAVRTQEAQAAAPNYSFRMFGYLPGSGFPLSYIQIPYHPDFNYFPLVSPSKPGCGGKMPAAANQSYATAGCSLTA